MTAMAINIEGFDLV